MWVTELQIILCLCDGVRGMNSTAETRRRRVKRREDIIEGGWGFRRGVTSVIVGRNQRRHPTFTDFRLPARAGEGQHRDPEPHDQAGRGADRLSNQLEMAPRAVISGRVVDEAGDPVQGARVRSVPVTPGSIPVVLMAAPNPTGRTA